MKPTFGTSSQISAPAGAGRKANAATGRSCPLCRGTRKAGRTTFTADLGFGVIVIRDVPATVCSQCGEEWIADDVAESLERLAGEARTRRQQVGVISFKDVNTPPEGQARPRHQARRDANGSG